MTTYTGTPSTLVAGDTSALVTKFNDHRDALKAVTEAWTTYTPTWTSSGTNPSLGNGSFAGSAYSQAGKLIIGRIVLTMGSTTTYGTGTWNLTLPVTPAAGIVRSMMNGVAKDASPAADYPLFPMIVGGSTSLVMRTLPSTAGSSLVIIGPAAPITWANGDVLTIDFCYEAA